MAQGNIMMILAKEKQFLIGGKDKLFYDEVFIADYFVNDK